VVSRDREGSASLILDLTCSWTSSYFAFIVIISRFVLLQLLLREREKNGFNEHLSPHPPPYYDIMQMYEEDFSFVN